MGEWSISDDIISREIKKEKQRQKLMRKEHKIPQVWGFIVWPGEVVSECCVFIRVQRIQKLMFVKTEGMWPL